MTRLFATVSADLAPRLRPHPLAPTIELVGKLEAALRRITSLPIRMDGKEPHWRDLRAVVAVSLREERIQGRSLLDANVCDVVTYRPTLPDHFTEDDLRASREVHQAVEFDVDTSDHLGRPTKSRFRVGWDRASKKLVLDAAPGGSRP